VGHSGHFSDQGSDRQRSGFKEGSRTALNTNTYRGEIIINNDKKGIFIASVIFV
jgi:hypothetical protein